MIWHNATSDEVLNELEVTTQEGLSDQKAKERLLEYGKNLYVCEDDTSIVKAIVSQLKKPSIIILLCLIFIYILREMTTGRNNYLLPIISVVLLSLKGAACVFAEYLSRNYLTSLKNQIHTSALVIRNGKEVIIKAENLVPGDIIKLSEGDFVPADARLIDSFALRCDESILYNEKEIIAVSKTHDVLHEDHTPSNERSNMIYCGCSVISGSATAVVTETGENAEIRRIVKKEKVFHHKDIQDRISDRFSGFLKVFTASALAASALITIFGTFVVRGPLGWGKFLEALIVAVCFFIAVVPGSFATRLGCLLSLGIKRLKKDKAVIYSPQTVEKLAGVTVICADKTGTLTQNRMSLRTVYDGENHIDLGTYSISKQCEIAMRFGALSCDITDNDVPDHTEAALVTASSRYLNLTKSDFDKEFPRMAVIPLTPERKIKTTVNMIEGKPFAIVRGAPDIVVDLCIDVDREKITKAYEELCSKGLRVLAISYKVLDDVPTIASSEELESNLQFLGLFGIFDRERKGISNDVELCRKAGISTVMFTGDHINTAATFAEKTGIITQDELSVTGEQLDTLSDEELVAVIGKIKACARISSEQRIRMVNAYHECGETVLITADSAANSEAMGVADVGCAMGKTGTDVAKGNADVMIYDDSFSTIVKAIRNARGIFGNFTKYVNYYVAMCSAVFVTLLMNIILFREFSPSASMILFGAIFSLVFPIAALGFETADIKIMRESPRTIGEKLFDTKKLIICAAVGSVIAIPSIIVFLINRFDASGPACLISLVMTFIYYMFTTRSSDLLYKRILKNKYLLGICGVCVVVLILLVSTPIGKLFGFVQLAGIKEWLTALLIPLVVPITIEFLKFFKQYNKIF